MTPDKLKRSCNQWLPHSELDDGEKSPENNSSLKYNAILQLMLLCRRQNGWDEVPDVDLVFTLINNFKNKKKKSGLSLVDSQGSKWNLFFGRRNSLRAFPIPWNSQLGTRDDPITFCALWHCWGGICCPSSAGLYWQGWEMETGNLGTVWSCHGNNNDAPGIAKQAPDHGQSFPEIQTGSSHLGPGLRREVNICTDPKDAFGTVHAHGRVWEERGVLTSQGSSEKYVTETLKTQKAFPTKEHHNNSLPSPTETESKYCKGKWKSRSSSGGSCTEEVKELCFTNLCGFISNKSH